MVEQRPNPEKLLQQAKEEENKQNRGKLKIYLGAAPGVGKTYTMLQDAIAKRAQGLDVVVGIIESHGRREIESLFVELEILPRQVVTYRDKRLFEFDIDAALKRDPGLVLIDEMAHTNIPGLRHEKRWQDIKELLDRGIDVWTTLNVQHIESLNDAVSQIIGTHIKETVPDSVLELANTIELVDLPPEDLIKRLQEGKVYFPQQAELARENFFRIGNLIALREIALRFTAEQVGEQVLLYRRGHDIKHVWPTNPKILVCVGFGSDAIKLIRTGRRIASGLQTDWIVLHVNTPKLRLTEEQRNNAIQNLRFAEQLGAETRIITGFDAVKEILNFAQEQNINRIIMGKKIRPRWKDFLFKSLTDEVVRNSGEIDVYIITGELIPATPIKSTTPKSKIPWKVFGIAIGIVTVATVIDYFVYDYSRPSNLVMVYLLGVTLVALFGRMGPAILASLLSVLAYDFFFVPPTFSFSNTDLQYVFTLVVMLLVGLIISHLTIIIRHQADIASIAERRSSTLLTLSRQLANTRGINNLLNIAVQYISTIFDSEVIALLPRNNTLTVRAKYKSEQILNEKELGVAQWVFDLGQIAGLGTNTLPLSDAIYVPLLASQRTIGVLRLRPFQPKHLFTPEQMHLLEACVNQLAVAIDADRLYEQHQKLNVKKN